MFQEKTHPGEVIINDKTPLQPPEAHQTEPVTELDYRTIFENTATAMAVLEEDFTMTRVNREFIELFGSSREKLEGNTDWLQYIYKSDLAVLSNYYQLCRLDPDSAPRNCVLSIVDHWGIEKNIWLSAAIIPGNSRSVVSLMDITKNKQMETRMSYRLHLEEAVAKTSRKLISHGDDNIEEVLKLVGEAMEVNRVYIFQFRQQGKKMDNTYEWCDQDTTPQKDNMQNIDTSLFPWWTKIVMTGQPHAITDAQDIPLEATREWQTIKSWGVRSLLSVPISNPAGDIVGFIGFMTYKQTQPWLSEDSVVMRIVAEMLGLYWERKKAEGLLQRYHLIFENARDIILLMHQNGQIIDVNSEACQVYGYNRDQLLSFKVIDLRAPETRSMAIPQMDEANIRGILFETLHCRKNGSIFPVEVSSQGITIESRRYILSVVRDISQRKKTEESLIRISTALDSASNGIVLSDPHGNQLIYQNQAFSNMFGYTLEELNDAGGLPVLFVDPRVAREVYKSLHEGNIWQGELELCTNNRRIIQVLLYADRILNDAGVVLGLFGVYTDITEQKLAASALAMEKERLAVTLHSIGDGVIATDTDGKLLLINPVAEEIIGWKQDEVIGRALVDFLELSDSNSYQVNHQVENDIELILNSSNQTECLVQDAILAARDGSIKTVSVNSAPILNNERQAIGHVLVIRDVTDLIKSQIKMALSQKLESIGALAAGIAHEINSPLQYISDNTVFFQESISSLVKVIKCYQEVVGAAERIIDLASFTSRVRAVEEEMEINYLLEEIPLAIEQSMDGIQRVRKLVLAMKEFSHPGTKEKKPSDLNKGIEATITISRNEWKYGAELHTDLVPELPLVNCVIDEINQVILNIIVNAAQAINEVIERGGYARGSIHISSCLKEEYVEIKIADNGIGIPHSLISKIYDPFFTTKPVGKGTGQGLAIAHDIIVNKHQGSIDVSSEEGQGSTFIIRLPVNSPEGYQEDGL